MALPDTREININTFATVVELCPGKDLDSHLKRLPGRCCSLMGHQLPHQDADSA